MSIEPKLSPVTIDASSDENRARSSWAEPIGEFLGLNIEDGLRRIFYQQSRVLERPIRVMEMSPQDWDDLVSSLEHRKATTFQVVFGHDRVHVRVVIQGFDVKVFASTHLLQWQFRVVE